MNSCSVTPDVSGTLSGQNRQLFAHTERTHKAAEGDGGLSPRSPPTVFPHSRLSLHGGDSAVTVPAFVAEHAGSFHCDLLFVDGDHDYASVRADLRNLRPLANMTSHVVVMDDMNLKGTRRAWEDERGEGTCEGSVGEIFAESAVVMELGGVWTTKAAAGGLVEIGVGTYLL
jgi:hypothetical protein